jgi:cation transport ATPase
MRADYASGPEHARSIVNLQALARCVREGIVVRDPDALGRLLDVDVFLIEHHPALEATEPEVDAVRVFPDHSEYQVLRFAAAALRDVDDDRAPALEAACEARRIPPLDDVAIEYGGDLILRVDDHTVKVGNLGVDDPAPPGGARPAGEPGLDALMVGVDGRIAGLIHFRRSSRAAAATAIRDLRACTRRSLAVGLISRRPDARLGGLAEALGFDFHEAGMSNGDLDHLIRACRKRGLTVAYVGDCLDRPAAAREADLAVCLDARDLMDLDRNPAAAVFLAPDLGKLATLYEVAREQRKAIKTAEGAALVPNLFCVAGALLMGFSSMTTVVVTNLATYGTYARNASVIRDMEVRLSRSSPGRRSRAAAPTAPRTS